MSSSGNHVALTPVPGEGDLGLVDALAQLSFAIHGTIGRIAAAHGLSIVQARLLGILRDRQPTITELAAFLAVDKSSVTGLVDRAAKRGLVRRAPSTVDGRRVQVTITGVGHDLAAKVAAAVQAEVAVLTAELSAPLRGRLSAAASQIVAADARRRGVDIFATGR